VVADKILAHSGAALDSVARIYQRYGFEAERAAALNLWAEYVTACAAKAAPAVAARVAENARRRAEQGAAKWAASLARRAAKAAERKRRLRRQDEFRRAS
jgi:alkyl sulfatase BDS1-like metallo-beta-lactamase superfamily hydrolase